MGTLSHDAVRLFTTNEGSQNDWKDSYAAIKTGVIQVVVPDGQIVGRWADGGLVAFRRRERDPQARTRPELRQLARDLQQNMERKHTQDQGG